MFLVGVISAIMNFQLFLRSLPFLFVQMRLAAEILIVWNIAKSSKKQDKTEEPTVPPPQI